MATIASPPARTLEQRLTSLDEANRVRLGRAALKRRIRAGELSLLEALAHEYAQTASVYEMVVSVRRWGPIRTRALLAMLHIHERRRVAQLTDRQRKALDRLARRGR